MWPEKIPKIIYFFWDNSPMSYIRFLTLFSFRYHNPDWKIYLYRPMFPSKVIIASETEIIPPHSIKYNGYDYSNRINELNIEEIQFDFQELGISNNIPLVHKIAFLKYYLVSKGGVWSDMDILYIKSMNDLIITDDKMISGVAKNIAMSVSFYKKDLVEITKKGFYYTGFLFASCNNKFYQDLYESAKFYHDPKSYLSLDQELMKKIYPDISDIAKKYPDYALYNLDEKSIYRYWWGELSTLYETDISKNPYLDNNLQHENGVIGFHWFGGVPYSDIFMNNFDKPLKELNINFNGIFNKLINDCKIIDKNYKVPEYNIKKISIVMAYYNRKSQLLTTLNTIKNSKHPNFEVIIVDDNSSQEHKIDDIVIQFPFVKLIVIKPDEKKWINPCIPYNIGFKAATGDIIIIQNPECCHVGDVLIYVENYLRENDYFTFSCFPSRSYEMNNRINNIILHDTTNPCFWSGDKHNKIANLINKWHDNTDYSWYNHSKHNPSYLHFMSAIYKKHLEKLGGFDADFKDGYDFDDNDFLMRIKYDLELDIKLIPYIPLDQHLQYCKSNILCIHLYHDHSHMTNYTEKYNINKQIFENKHHLLVNKIINKLQNKNLYDNIYTIIGPQNKINVNRSILKNDNGNDSFINMLFESTNDDKSGIRFHINIPNYVTYSANQGKINISTDIYKVIKNNNIILLFEAKCNDGNNSIFYIDTGINEHIPIELGNEFIKYVVVTKLDINNWKINSSSQTNFTIKNFFIKLGNISN